MPSPPSRTSGPPLYWRLMRALQRHFGYFTSSSVHDIVGGGHRKTIESYLAFLLREGVIESCGGARHNGDARRYRIIRDGDAPPARRLEGSEMGLRQQALWTAMRGLRTFSPAELAQAASTESLVIAGETARSYIRDLRIAGYLSQVGEATYRLLPARNSGPRAPIVLRAEAGAFDLNLMRVVNVTAQGAVNHGRAA